MIQLAPHPHKPLGLFLLGAALGSLVACAKPPQPETIPRRLGGSTQRSPFVPPFAYEAYVRGELALSQGQYDQAVAQFELATAAPEEDAYLLARLAYAQALSGQLREAKHSLAHAEKVDPCSEAVWLTRGEIAEKRAELADSLQAYARASECAPDSASGAVGQARILDRQGKPSDALQILGSYRGAERAQAARIALEVALRSGDPAALAHALETWIGYQAPDAENLERAVDWALAHGEPELGRRIAEHHAARLPSLLSARLLRALGDRAGLARLVSRTPADELGGAESAAELALFAGVEDRAELEATTALARRPADSLFALRARARFALGHRDEALADVQAIGDLGLRRETLLALLEEAGNPALARELSRPAVLTQPAPANAQ